ncbi:MAG: hypothetical protein JXA71_06815, partial [Chitinispirillaceae bacterium]|nr:hypothetical protein [Chitinispirillaceae bacterium]
ALVTCFAVSVMVVGGLALVQKTLVTNQVSPALNWKMGYVYLCLPVSGLFITYYSLLRLGDLTLKLLKKEGAGT